MRHSPSRLASPSAGHLLLAWQPCGSSVARRSLSNDNHRTLSARCRIRSMGLGRGTRGDRFGPCSLEPPIRIELMTFSLRVGCSTDRAKAAGLHCCEDTARKLSRSSGAAITESSPLALQVGRRKRAVDEEVVDGVVHAAVRLVVGRVAFTVEGDELPALELIGQVDGTLVVVRKGYSRVDQVHGRCSG